MLRLNVRQRIIAGFLILSICLGGQTLFSYKQLLLVEDKTYSVEFIDDVESSILNFRRQEKNYLLYGEKSSYQLALSEIEETLELLGGHADLNFDEAMTDSIIELKKTISEYRDRIVAMYAAATKQKRNLDDEVGKLREIGQELVFKAQSIADLERANILKINRQLRKQLLFSILAVTFLFLCTLYFITKRIVGPLKVIEETTTQIAQGNFAHVDVKNMSDEISKVQIAFNRMVSELEHRQAQLVQAQKMSSIGTLSAGIAHQVNNPLNNISTSAQILQGELKESINPFAKKLLDNIETETARARDIVRGLLEFARCTELSLRTVSLKNVVDNAVQLVSSQIPSGVTLEVNVPDNIFVHLDPQRMGEVLINLIINATQAMKEQTSGFISISVLKEQVEDFVTLVVSDSGEGIPEEDLPKVFDPFFTSKDVGEGTGLGLSVAYGIIEEFDGEIRVESTLGAGSRFYIDLPLRHHD
ncbi:sensor histidine kinase [Halodesulfovibrio aestuarii]|uniref:histidine kinase n=1 Tax=Halodesulfovibrio aestuarii TaxID=126333 RepID=A0A8G2C8G1_9BACT|nr:ATP-binding protein [Halodesulfovibrio aestuarii]SHI80682.1 His Kinase A (phospho-acceptor) domain-containing protein [Halodesulfovibrio aestuarii]